VSEHSPKVKPEAKIAKPTLSPASDNLGGPEIALGPRFQSVSILKLQQTIGNRAVQRLLAIQRDPDDGADAGSQPQDTLDAGSLVQSAHSSTAADTLQNLDLKSQPYSALQPLLIDIEMQLSTLAPDEADYTILQELFKAIKAERDTKLNAIVDGFSAPVKADNAYPQSIEDRIDFMDGMHVYVGDDDAIQKHFQAIQYYEIPSKNQLPLHPRAGTRLKAVYDKLGSAMPSTTVGFGLRNRYHPEAKQQPMGHVLGYAIDYHARENPHVTDPRLWRTLEMETGGKSSFKGRYSDYGKRRGVLDRMGKNTATDAERQDYLDNFAEQFQEVSDASKNFGEGLGKAARERIVQTYQFFKASRQLESLKKKLQVAEDKLKANPKSKKLQGQRDKLAAQKEQLEKRIGELAPARKDIEADLPKLFEPWLKEVAAKKQKLAADHDAKLQPLLAPDDQGYDVANIQSTLDQPVGKKTQLDIAQKQAADDAKVKGKAFKTLSGSVKKAKDQQASLERQIEKENKKKQPSQTQIGKWQGQLDKIKTDLPTQEKSLQEALTARDQADHHLKLLSNLNSPSLKGLRQDWANYLWLERTLTLTTNPAKSADDQAQERSEKFEFIFGNGEDTHSNPSLGQVMDQGFFNPESTDDQGKVHQHGFTLEFMQLMAQNGFDQGVNWSPGSVDSMHFELIEGMNTLPSGKKRDQEIDLVRQERKVLRDARALTAKKLKTWQRDQAKKNKQAP